MRSKNLVQSWLEVELEHNKKTLTEALHTLNKTLGTSHTHSRVREWGSNRRGRGERLPRTLRLFMLRMVLKPVLESEGISTRKLTARLLNRLSERLS